LEGQGVVGEMSEKVTTMKEQQLFHELVEQNGFL
jgi:hypothetical protein